jgi:hypothetical protein
MEVRMVVEFFLLLISIGVLIIALAIQLLHSADYHIQDRHKGAH